MARRRRRRKKVDPLDYITIPRLNIDPEIKRGILALFLLALSIISVLALFGKAGIVGNYLGISIIWLFGWGQWLFPIAILVLVWLIFNHERLEIQGTNYFGLFLFLVSFQGLLQLFISPDKWVEALDTGIGGGHFGWLIALFLLKIIGFWASIIILVVLILVSLMLIFNTTLASILVKGSWPARLLLHPFKFLFNSEHEEEEEEEEDEEEENDDEDEEEEEEDDEKEEDDESNEESDEDNEESSPQFNRYPLKQKTNIQNNSVQNIWKSTGIKIDLPLSLLSNKSTKAKGGDIKNNIAIIKKTLEEFNVQVEMRETSVGPTVTQYTLKPADGIRLSKITALNSDLAMALAAHPVRIEAPIPGKSLVGIEVPNKSVALVGLRSIINSDIFKNRKTNTMITLGRDVAGKVWLADLHKMPHLLVAGATGSGKSVLLNTLIISLLYENNPDDLRFIMVDPKRVELTAYNGIPHLLTPVITDVKKTINALKWCLNEMDTRFQILAKARKRDIDSYNKSSKHKMPFIVFIIDELADLMVVAAKDIETSIVRLAQMARAVGIHLVLATQRPSVNVITGTIKANMPARIAFSVASGIDSRTILDSLGAEKLLGRGDMLFSDASLPKPKRIQGAFVSEQEIKKITNYLRAKTSPIYLDNVIEKQKVHGVAGVGIDGSNTDDDELTSEAKEIIINAGKASATLLQRRLSIGYARAAKILDTLEEAGIIGPSQGSKPREVLITKEQYEGLMQQKVSGVALHNQEESVPPAEYLQREEDEEESSVSVENEEEGEGEEEEKKKYNKKEERDEENDEEEDESKEEENDEEEDEEENETEDEDEDEDEEENETEDEDEDEEEENETEDEDEDEEEENENDEEGEEENDFEKYFSR